MMGVFQMLNNNLLKHETVLKRLQMKIRPLFRIAVMKDKKVHNKARRIHLINNCGATRYYYLDIKKIHKALNLAYFCDERLCPEDGSRKAYQAHMKLSTMLKYLNTKYVWKNGRPRYLPIFATFTVPNCADSPKAFKKTYRRLHKAFHKIMNYNRYNGLNHRAKGIIQGGTGKTEFTYNLQNDTFNLHIHALLFVHLSYFKSRYYTPSKIWQADWERANNWNAKKRGCHLQVRIEAPYVRTKKGKHISLKQYIKIAKAEGSIKTPPQIETGFIKEANQESSTELTKYETKATDFLKALMKIKNPKKRIHPFLTAYFGTKHERAYSNLGLLKKLATMYNKGQLDKLKPKDNHIYKYNMNAFYYSKPKKFRTKKSKMLPAELKEARRRGKRTIMLPNERKNYKRVKSIAKQIHHKKQWKSYLKQIHATHITKLIYNMAPLSLKVNEEYEPTKVELENAADEIGLPSVYG